MKFQKNIQTIVFLLVIGILLISPAVYWLSRDGQWTLDSILEDRELTVFPQVSARDFKTALKRIYQGLYPEAGEIFFNQFLDTSFQRRVNKAAAEQMLARIPLVELSKVFERLTIRSAYLALPDQALPASFDSGLFVARDGSCLMQEVVNFTEVEKAAVDARIANYEELLEKHPDIYFYVFNIETLPYSVFHPMAAYFPQSDSGRSLAYFLENKPADLPFVNFSLSDFQDYREKFFRTDQHWNIRASLEAYRQLYAMFKEQYPEISPMLQPKYIRQVEGLEFYGSLARKSLYPVPPDILEYTSVGKLDYQTFVDGIETK
jgi:hypothetical protein